MTTYSDHIGAAQKLLEQQKTINEQVEEIREMRQLLSRWQAQSKYLFDCYDAGAKWQSAELESIIKKTDEVLK